VHVLIEERPSHVRVGLLCSCVAAGRAYAERLGSDLAQIRTFSTQKLVHHVRSFVRKLSLSILRNFLYQKLAHNVLSLAAQTVRVYFCVTV
jgi:hypothetical protein